MRIERNWIANVVERILRVEYVEKLFDSHKMRLASNPAYR